jgi:hypothetical protein
MVVNTSEPRIPTALREAFGEALADFADWGRTKIIFEGRPTSISLVFFWAMGFDDSMPDATLRTVLRCAARSDYAVGLLEGPAYGNGARFLFRLTQATNDGRVNACAEKRFCELPLM